MRVRFLVFLVALVVASSLSAQRLPRTVLPSHYDLTFTPDFGNDSFDGDETIHVTVAVPLQEIVLHAVEIDFREVRVSSGGTTQTATVTLEPEREWARLRLDRPVNPGPATIHIRYRGVLNGSLTGLYLGVANGKKYASTQMEATYARQAFPSFDEPAMKATFAIAAIVDEGHTAISNGAVIADEKGPAPGKHTIRFATTRRMSTYLVALTVGDFRCDRSEADGIDIGICGTPDRVRLSQFATDATKAILPWFNEYYGIRYPFGKLDQTGVADFAAGAMENAGAILYRDGALFLDPSVATGDEMRGVSGIISHEIAHMWFGDLVTMRWWDDIWLNEGFATWVAPKPLAAWKPEWKVPLREVASGGYSMAADSLETSRRIRQDATTPEEIDELFDGIAYGKTAAVLRMIESYIGEDAMRRGISSYLTTHAWGNTTYHDFSESISKASDAPVTEILRTFVEQPGVPVLRATSRCENGKTQLVLAQERFYSNPAAKPAGEQTWAVPVCYRAGGERRCEVVREARQTLSIEGCAPVFLNADGRGYYITEHSMEMGDALLASIGVLTPAERLVLLRDEWNLVRSGRRSVDRYLRLAEAMRGEREPLVVGQLIGPFDTIRREIATGLDRTRFTVWVRQYLQPLAKELGWTPGPGESEERRELRAKVLLTLGIAGEDQEVLRQARKVLERELAGKTRLDPELHDAAVDLAAAGGDAKLYETYLKRMKNAATPSEQNRFRNALARFPQDALVRRTIELALSDQVRTQDAAGLIAATVRDNPGGPERSWSLVEQNWTRIEKKLPERMLGGILSSANELCDRPSLERVRAFYAAHPSPSAARTTAQSLERIQQCIAFRDAQASPLHKWLLEIAGGKL